MLDKTIDSALCQLRATIIRDGLEGLGHVEVLLAMRGVALPYVRCKIPHDSCAQGEVKRIVLASLRGGPKTATQIGNAITAARPDIAPARAMRRVWRALYRMHGQGVVRRDGRLWGLAR